MEPAQDDYGSPDPPQKPSFLDKLDKMDHNFLLHKLRFRPGLITAVKVEWRSIALQYTILSIGILDIVENGLLPMHFAASRRRGQILSSGVLQESQAVGCVHSPK